MVKVFKELQDNHTDQVHRVSKELEDLEEVQAHKELKVRQDLQEYLVTDILITMPFHYLISVVTFVIQH